MKSKTYRLLDLIMGWGLFVAASLVYLLTMEPTASFWDCGEFIACGYKLIVGHPPGAPFFMLLVRLFTLFAGNVEQVGPLANAMSALASGATIMFLYWTIARLAQRLVIRENDAPISLGQTLTIVGAALVGAACYTFTDTFWFSAVEGEVYALSSLFTAIVFWAILRWEETAHQPQANRWIVLIAYLMGLSIGVHLLNLLVIPAIVLVYYFKNYRFTWWGMIKALMLSGVLLLAVLYGVIQGLVVLASYFELLFVNGFSLPFMSGAIVFFVLLAVGLTLGILLTRRRRAYLANLFFICFAMLLLGYSSFSVIVIRSLADPTLDQNGVDNMFALKAYLNREQYGDRPLLHGPYFDAPPIDYQDGAPVYSPRGDRYEIVNRKTKVVYDERFTTPFPRMWSREPIHIQGYKMWVDLRGQTVEGRDANGQSKLLIRPTFGQNLQFFFRYQLGFMYWRYFMWNFSGRQNDFQGYGHNVLRGNWISGIPFIDTPRLGPQNALPEPYASNRAHNRYYMLPLLLGCLGLVFHFRKHPRDAGVVLTLFILTGIAIVVYLNQKPYEPRERDYSYAASFYAFAIWVGLGVVPLARLLAKIVNERIAAAIATVVAFVLVPLHMGRENWDDHDRSGRYVSVDFGKNLLNSAGPHGILCTYADNDTFPLWYAQEVEGCRPDVRICNLTYLGGDWFIDVMNRKAYDGDPLPFGIDRKNYLEGKNDVVLVQDRLNRPIDLKSAMNFVLSDDPRSKIRSPFIGGGALSYFPSKQLLVPVPRSTAERIVNPQFYPRILDTVLLEPNTNVLHKNGFAMYGVMANNQWERPLCYSPMLPKSMYWGLDKYFVKQGIVSAVQPVKNEGEVSMIDTAQTYKNLMEVYSFRSIADDRVYLDETCKRMIEYYVESFSLGAEAMISNGDSVRAERLVDACFEKVPPQRVGWSYQWLPLIQAYYRVEATEKGRTALLEYAEECLSVLEYAERLGIGRIGRMENEINIAKGILSNLVHIATVHKDQESLDFLMQRVNL